ARTGAFDLPRGLIICKPEKLVLQKRPADRVSELVATQLRARRFSVRSGRGLVVEEVVRVEFVIADKLEHVSVNPVGSRLGDRIHDRAAEFTVLGIEAVGD